jgi:hypothetical protein
MPIVNRRISHVVRSMVAQGRGEVPKALGHTGCGQDIVEGEGRAEEHTGISPASPASAAIFTVSVRRRAQNRWLGGVVRPIRGLPQRGPGGGALRVGSRIWSVLVIGAVSPSGVDYAASAMA